MVESRDSEPGLEVDHLTLASLLEDVRRDLGEVGAIRVSGVSYRSKSVRPGDAFFCIPGFVHDGHDFAVEAVRAGAGALIVKRNVDGAGEVPQIVVPDTRRALALASAKFYGHPSRQMNVVGVTGTNGKTTTTYLLDSIFRSQGHTTGLIGTVEFRTAGRSAPAGRTTPESADLQAMLADMVRSDVSAVAMEVSSHAIDLHRVDGVRFAVAAFTNLSQDHLDYHSTLEEYFAVKRRLFTEMDVGERVVNIDDPHGAGLAASIGAKWTVGTDPGALVRATEIDMGPHRSRFVLGAPEGEIWVELPLAAGYNIENALVAAACAMALGADLGSVAEGLRAASQVPGRLERVDAGQDFAVFVDYAHTPDSLEKAILAVRGITSGRVITVFGCGGDRDPEKRPLMGLAAGRHSDLAIVTTDNPRSEDPVGIILRIEEGLKSSGGTYEVEVDRRRAIALALASARASDAVLIAGKGHEDYQELSDRTIPFDDRDIALEELGRLC